jgi:peptidoglycan hydrolase-like protein with peptidoglycan-binding domain
MKAACSFLLCLLISGNFALGDEQVRRVQEELRKRNLYFGDVDGQATKETKGALRRYQERKGFNASGEVDGDTLRSLNLAAPIAVASNAAPWPNEPVLRSHAARQVSEEDQKFLAQLVSDPAEPVAEGPESDDEGSESAPPAPARDNPASASGPGAAPGTPPPATDPALQQRVEGFLRDYLQTTAKNDPEGEVVYFAETVNYFDHGKVDRSFIRRDVQRYNKRWPQRDFQLENVKVTPVGNDEAVVKFEIKFQVSNPKSSASGRTANTFRVKEEEDGKFKFVSVKERHLRD